MKIINVKKSTVQVAPCEINVNQDIWFRDGKTIRAGRIESVEQGDSDAGDQVYAVIRGSDDRLYEVPAGNISDSKDGWKKVRKVLDKVNSPRHYPGMAKAKAPAAQKIDPDTLKKLRAEIDAEERTLFAEFEAKMKEKRGKALASIIEPLQAERAELQKTIDDADMRLREIDREISSMTGVRAPKAKSGGSGTGKRVRRSAEQLAADAHAVLAYMKKNPGQKSSAIAEGAGVEIKSPLNPKTLVEKYVSGVKVETSGNKASTVYSVA